MDKSAWKLNYLRRDPFDERRIVLHERHRRFVPQQYLLDLLAGVDVDEVQGFVPQQQVCAGEKGARQVDLFLFPVSRLVLPLPLGPMTATRSPGAIVKDSLENTGLSPRHRLRLFATTSDPATLPGSGSRRCRCFSTSTSVRRRSSAAFPARRSAMSAFFICRLARFKALSLSRFSAPARRSAATCVCRPISCFNGAFSERCLASRCRKRSRQAENDVRSTSTVSRFSATTWSQQASRNARSWEISRKPGLERR